MCVADIAAAHASNDAEWVSRFYKMRTKLQCVKCENGTGSPGHGPALLTFRADSGLNTINTKFVVLRRRQERDIGQKRAAGMALTLVGSLRSC